MPANAATPTDRAAVPTPAPTATSANHARAWKQATGNGAQRSSARTARIQAALAHHHAYDGPIDGLIGPGTLMAIRTFQRSLGDTATGVLTRSEIIQLVTF
jgi:peptidoglycan hydrolase-like protein with peptidoglycan-binding domain